MDKNYLNDPKFRSSIILYEFLSGNPICKCFERLCTRVGPDVDIEYREVDFWFQRFAGGNFDIDYDMSLVPKTREFTDLPINIIETITCNLEPFSRLVLRNVCKTFRTLVDSWEPKLDGKFVKEIEIRVDQGIALIFNRGLWRYCCDSENSCTVGPDHGKRFEQKGNILDVAIDDLVSILCHPNLKLNSFVIDTLHKNYATANFAKKLVMRMEKCTHRPQIPAENVHFSCSTSFDEVKMLKFFKAGTVKNLRIGYSNIIIPDNSAKQVEIYTKEIAGLELWETIEEVTFLPSILQADEKCSLLRIVHAPKMTLTFGKLLGKSFKRILQTLLQKNPRLQFCKLEIKARFRFRTFTARKLLESIGATPSSGSYKFPIPNSDNFFSIAFSDATHYYLRSFVIERKQNISE